MSIVDEPQGQPLSQADGYSEGSNLADHLNELRARIDKERAEKGHRVLADNGGPVPPLGGSPDGNRTQVEHYQHVIGDLTLALRTAEATRDAAHAENARLVEARRVAEAALAALVGAALTMSRRSAYNFQIDAMVVPHITWDEFAHAIRQVAPQP